MNTGDIDKVGHAHLDQWLETTRRYLFADWESLAGAAGKALPEPRLDSHGAQDRYISRARGSLLRLVKRTARHARSPLQELECAFYSQASFIARHPDVPGRLLGLAVASRRYPYSPAYPEDHRPLRITHLPNDRSGQAPGVHQGRHRPACSGGYFHRNDPESGPQNECQSASERTASA